MATSNALMNMLITGGKWCIYCWVSMFDVMNVYSYIKHVDGKVYDKLLVDSIEHVSMVLVHCSITSSALLVTLLGVTDVPSRHNSP